MIAYAIALVIRHLSTVCPFDPKGSRHSPQSTSGLQNDPASLTDFIFSQLLMKICHDNDQINKHGKCYFSYVKRFSLSNNYKHAYYIVFFFFLVRE